MMICNWFGRCKCKIITIEIRLWSKFYIIFSGKWFEHLVPYSTFEAMRMPSRVKIHTSVKFLNHSRSLEELIEDRDFHFVKVCLNNSFEEKIHLKNEFKNISSTCELNAWELKNWLANLHKNVWLYRFMCYIFDFTVSITNNKCISDQIVAFFPFSSNSKCVQWNCMDTQYWNWDRPSSVWSGALSRLCDWTERKSYVLDEAECGGAHW